MSRGGSVQESRRCEGGHFYVGINIAKCENFMRRTRGRAEISLLLYEPET
jgi:hypothetical protein